MGAIKFRVHPQKLLEDVQLGKGSYFCGPDSVPWVTQGHLEDGRLLLSLPQTDRGKFVTHWPVAGFGQPMLSTSTLLAGETDYWLPLELARGKLNQVRNQMAVYERLGWTGVKQLSKYLYEAQRVFHSAAMSQHSPEICCRDADRALAAAVLVGEKLVERYSNHNLEKRRKQGAIAVYSGCELPHELPTQLWDTQLSGSFNSARVPLNWRYIEPVEGESQWDLYDAQIDWCITKGLSICGGPLLSLSPTTIPDWLWLWEGDFDNLQNCAAEFVQSVINRYRGKISVWEVTARMNSSRMLSLSEEQRLRLSVYLLEVAHQVDPGAQWVVRIDQPWGEYVANGDQSVTPINFVDTLLRVDRGIKAVSLEVSMGYSSPGSWMRDSLEFSRMLDDWGYLGIDVHLMLAVPSSHGSDSVSSQKEISVKNVWQRSWDESLQKEWVERFFPMILSKPFVKRVTWCHLYDNQPHELPHAGLVGPDGTPKPALSMLLKLNQKLLV